MRFGKASDEFSRGASSDLVSVEEEELLGISARERRPEGVVISCGSDLVDASTTCGSRTQPDLLADLAHGRYFDAAQV